MANLDSIFDEIGELLGIIKKETPEHGHALWDLFFQLKNELMYYQKQHTETIQALRDSLESVQAGERSNIQKAVAASSAENKQLQLMIQQQRHEMEEIKRGEAERTQKALSNLRNEGDSLKETIQSLRENLQKSEISGEENVQETKKTARLEVDQLHGNCIQESLRVT